MARKWPDHFDLPDGRRVGYSFAKRGKIYVVRFESPEGDYWAKSTKKETIKDALTEAAKIVLRSYGVTQTKAKVSWDEVVEKLKQALTCNNNRQRTYQDYASAIRVLRATIETKGPHDIDETKAKVFKSQWMMGTFKRAKGDDAQSYARKPSSLNSYLRKLRSIWGEWLIKQFRLVTANPWLLVKDAEEDDRITEFPPEEVFVAFHQWVGAQYPGWDLPVLFLQTKLHMGCRLFDLCAVQSSQLANGCLTMDPSITKARNFRRVKLPADLYAKLHALKGQTFLWESYTVDLRDTLKRLHRHSRKVAETFEPTALYWFANSLFRDYNACHAAKINSHDYRRRAVSKAFDGGFSREDVARMFGLTAQTAETYYDAWTHRNTDAHFDQLAPALQLPDLNLKTEVKIAPEQVSNNP